MSALGAVEGQLVRDAQEQHNQRHSTIKAVRLDYQGIHESAFLALALPLSLASSQALTYAHPPHKSAPRDAGVNHRNMIRQFRFEDTVEVLASADGAERIAVGELGEDTDLVGVFKLGAGRHALLRSDQRDSAGGCGWCWWVGWELVEDRCGALHVFSPRKVDLTCSTRMCAEEVRGRCSRLFVGTLAHESVILTGLLGTVRRSFWGHRVKMTADLFALGSFLGSLPLNLLATGPGR